jgi:hypothetical protein
LHPSPGVTAAQAAELQSNYDRARSVCFQARGYTLQ